MWHDNKRFRKCDNADQASQRPRPEEVHSKILIFILRYIKDQILRLLTASLGTGYFPMKGKVATFFKGSW